MTEVNGVAFKLAQLERMRNAAADRGDFTEAGKLQAMIMKFDPQPKGGTEVEHAGTQPLTAEQQATKKAAQQNGTTSFAKMKKELDLKGNFADLGLGWLARENKVDIEQKGPAVKVSLK